MQAGPTSKHDPRASKKDAGGEVWKAIQPKIKENLSEKQIGFRAAFYARGEWVKQATAEDKAKIKRSEGGACTVCGAKFAPFWRPKLCDLFSRLHFWRDETL